MDPFYIVKKEVEAQLVSLRSQKIADPDALVHISADLDDLQSTIVAVQSNPQNFNISTTELSNRRQFITNSRAEVSRFSNPRKEQPTHRSQEYGAIKQSNSTRRKDGDDYGIAQGEMLEQTRIMDSQDQKLGAVLNTVRDLNEIARVMGNELDDQTRLIANVEERTEVTQNSLDSGLKRVKDFVAENSSSKQQWIIVGLCIALCIVLALVLTL